MDKGIFLGYSSDKKAYKFYNRRTLVIEGIIYFIFYEYNDVLTQKFCENDDVGDTKRLNLSYVSCKTRATWNVLVWAKSGKHMEMGFARTSSWETWGKKA